MRRFDPDPELRRKRTNVVHIVQFLIDCLCYLAFLGRKPWFVAEVTLPEFTEYDADGYPYVWDFRKATFIRRHDAAQGLGAGSWSFYINGRNRGRVERFHGPFVFKSSASRRASEIHELAGILES